MTDIPVWEQIVFAVIGSGVSGSVASIILSPIIARHEIRKLEITYSQKLNDNFIQNTREHRDDLYIPLNKSLSRLDDSYQTYKRKKRVLTSIRKGKVKKGLQPLRSDENAPELQSLRAIFRAATEEALKEFIQVYGAFNKLMEEINEDGRDTYLRDDFDERLRSFTQFLKTAGDTWCYIASTALDIEGTLTIDTKPFDHRFVATMRYLKSSIKEVTLGTTQHK
jgi:hypothetical protein